MTEKYVDIKYSVLSYKVVQYNEKYMTGCAFYCTKS